MMVNANCHRAATTASLMAPMSAYYMLVAPDTSRCTVLFAFCVESPSCCAVHLLPSSCSRRPPLSHRPPTGSRSRHYDDLDPEYVIDEGGFGSRDMFTPGRLVFGISVAEKKIMWLKLRAEGVAGHGSQPHDKNPNDHLLKALSRLFAEPLAAAPFPVVDTMKARIGGPLVSNKFNNAIQQSTISLTSLRSGVGDPPKVNVIPSVAEATLDCRVLPGTTAAQWLKEIERRLADPTIKIEVVYEGEDPTVSSQDTPLYRALEGAITRQHPEAIVTPMVVPYGTT